VFDDHLVIFLEYQFKKRSQLNLKSQAAHVREQKKNLGSRYTDIIVDIIVLSILNELLFKMMTELFNLFHTVFCYST
jgi:hypothetical protein